VVVGRCGLSLTTHQVTTRVTVGEGAWARKEELERGRVKSAVKKGGGGEASSNCTKKEQNKPTRSDERESRRDPEEEENCMGKERLRRSGTYLRGREYGSGLPVRESERGRGEGGGRSRAEKGGGEGEEK